MLQIKIKRKEEELTVIKEENDEQITKNQSIISQVLLC